MTKVLSNIGYAFAEVTPIPELNKDERTVAVTMFVNPGKRVLVRRVSFEGNVRTQDEVLRREMRQFEGAWFSQAAIDRSKIRLQRLGFFKTVEVDTPRVPGSDDQVDVVFKVEEQSSGAFQFGVGYSELQGLISSVSVTQRNFLGSGNSVGVTVQNNAFVKRYGGRLVNIHPSLLPAFPGLHAQRQALEHGVKVAGDTVHFVDEGVDTGPIIAQAAVPVLDDDTEESLSDRILVEEHRLYPEVVRRFAEGCVRLEGRRVSVR